MLRTERSPVALPVAPERPVLELAARLALQVMLEESRRPLLPELGVLVLRAAELHPHSPAELQSDRALVIFATAAAAALAACADWRQTGEA